MRRHAHATLLQLRPIRRKLLLAVRHARSRADALLICSDNREVTGSKRRGRSFRDGQRTVLSSRLAAPVTRSSHRAQLARVSYAFRRRKSRFLHRLWTPDAFEAWADAVSAIRVSLLSGEVD